MSELIFSVLGGAAVFVLMFVSKVLGGKKGKKVAAQDTERAAQAMEKATILLGKRAAVEAKDEIDRKRVESKLQIEDPAERLDAIADELKDL